VDPELKVFEDFLDDAGIVNEADNTKASAALGASQRVCKIHFANEASPCAPAKAAEVVVRIFIGT